MAKPRSKLRRGLAAVAAVWHNTPIMLRLLLGAMLVATWFLLPRLTGSVCAGRPIPFLWDGHAPDWYTVNVTTLPANRVGQTNFQPAGVNVHKLLTNALRRNHRPTYRLAAGLFDTLNHIDDETGARFIKGTSATASWSLEQLTQLLRDDGQKDAREARFRHVWVDGSGAIVDWQTCQGVRNGGCNHNFKFPFAPRQDPFRDGTQQPAKSMSPQHPEVHELIISIAMEWGAGIFHFPLEALVGLAHVDPATLSGSVVHVSEASSYVLAWLAVVGIEPQQVVEGPVFAAVAIAPQLGACGNPSPLQLAWLSRKVQLHIGAQLSVKHNTIVLVKRTNRRTVKNWDVLQQLTYTMAAELSLRVELHLDTDLPSLKEQLRMFARAAVVVAPHGAAETLLIAAQPGSCVIEWMDPEFVNLCYTRLAFLQRLQYIAVPLVQGVVQPTHLRQALSHCGRSGKTHVS